MQFPKSIAIYAIYPSTKTLYSFKNSKYDPITYMVPQIHCFSPLSSFDTIPIEINDHQEIGFGSFCIRPKIPEAISGHESPLINFEI